MSDNNNMEWDQTAQPERPHSRKRRRTAGSGITYDNAGDVEESGSNVSTSRSRVGSRTDASHLLAEGLCPASDITMWHRSTKKPVWSNDGTTLLTSLCEEPRETCGPRFILSRLVEEFPDDPIRIREALSKFRNDSGCEGRSQFYWAAGAFRERVLDGSISEQESSQVSSAFLEFCHRRDIAKSIQELKRMSLRHLPDFRDRLKTTEQERRNAEQEREKAEQEREKAERLEVELNSMRTALIDDERRELENLSKVVAELQKENELLQVERQSERERSDSLLQQLNNFHHRFRELQEAAASAQDSLTLEEKDMLIARFEQEVENARVEANMRIEEFTELLQTQEQSSQGQMQRLQDELIRARDQSERSKAILLAKEVFEGMAFAMYQCQENSRKGEMDQAPEEVRMRYQMREHILFEHPVLGVVMKHNRDSARAHTFAITSSSSAATEKWISLHRLHILTGHWIRHNTSVASSLAVCRILLAMADVWGQQWVIFWRQWIDWYSGLTGIGREEFSKWIGELATSYSLPHEDVETFVRSGMGRGVADDIWTIGSPMKRIVGYVWPRKQ